MLYLIALLVSTVVSVALIQVVMLKATATTFRKPGLTWRTALIVVLIAMPFSICSKVLDHLDSGNDGLLAVQVLCFVGFFVLPIILIKRSLQIKTRTSIAIVLVAAIASGVVAAGCVVGLRAYFMQAFRIPSHSMSPTLYAGDNIFANKFVYKLRTPRRGEIVVYRHPVDTSKIFIHRVVAVGGDTIEIRDNRVIINGTPYENDPGVPSGAEMQLDSKYRRDNLSPVTVPVGSFFVLGDNRLLSYDSRVWGFVSLGHIVGSPSIIYWSYDSERNRIRTERIGKRIR